MSPEQVLGRGADGRSDIFALGVVLYEMLTGATPFSGDTVSNLMYQIATAPAPAPNRINAEVPPMLDLIVAKALAKKPEERYQSAAAFAADLRECGTGLDAAVRRKRLDDTIVEDKTLRLAPNGESTRALSPHFDSCEATRRLAAATGTRSVIESQGKTLRVAPSPAACTSLRPASRDAPRTPPSRAGWNPRERLVIAASVIRATCAAVFIALA
jgi:serine/threonine-protein kinase